MKTENRRYDESANEGGIVVREALEFYEGRLLVVLTTTKNFGVTCKQVNMIVYACNFVLYRTVIVKRLDV